MELLRLVYIKQETNEKQIWANTAHLDPAKTRTVYKRRQLGQPVKTIRIVNLICIRLLH